MKIFSCSCEHQAKLFFESVQCTACGRLTGFCPDRISVVGFEPGGEPGLWVDPTTQLLYRQCNNYSQHQVCNWMIPADEPAEWCRACRLNEVIPDLSLPQNMEYWHRMEIAKRHALYTILELQLPMASKLEDPQYGMTFRFMTDTEPTSEFTEPLNGQEKVFTGHNNGTITINLAEADDIARTRTRIKLGESYRTLLGHMRHEIGHYYWYRLVENNPKALTAFREVFGDETIDYDTELHRHYDSGAPPDWPMRFISAYASMHPWEDWAECWAHYMHMLDTLETAQAFQLRISGGAIPGVKLPTQSKKYSSGKNSIYLSNWMQLSIAMNALNRSMGLPDAYPFILNDMIQNKLECIHQIIVKN
jgi:hypothetical protein